MKKVMILMAFVMMVINTQAQENVVKLGIGGVWYGGINLEYERVLTDKTSLLAEFGFTTPKDFSESRLDSWSNRFGIQDAESSIDLTTAKLNSFYLAAEYRFYVGQEVIKGFYVAPYLKYANYSASIDGTYDNNNQIDIDSDIEVGLSNVTIGAGIGYQIIINDQITVNWNIIGLGLGINRFKASFTSTDQSNVFGEWQEDVRKFLADLPFIGDNFDTESNNSTRTIDGSASYVSLPFRFGLSVGYMF